jgi:hypothetical protein
MKTHELLAMIGPDMPEEQRLQALQVLAVRSGVMVKQQQVSKWLNAQHFALISHELEASRSLP